MDPRLIVALDTADRRQALDLVETLQGVVRTFKIGLEFFSTHGPSGVREVASLGAQIFLDLKFHDIPNTVAGAVYSVCTLPGVTMVTVHASGGRQMLQAALGAARASRRSDFVSEVPGARRPALLGVSVLTSLDAQDLQETGVPCSPAEQVAHLARLTRESGLDGLVCSPLEVQSLRQALGNDFLLVAPGIRPAAATTGDQKRTATPAQAIRAGASYLVVGRPVTADPSPREAARRLLAALPRQETRRGHSFS
ncbi:MAG: orotidine-5'-phosphate decarboxylase [Acidobacteriota bacterium]